MFGICTFVGLVAGPVFGKLGFLVVNDIFERLPLPQSGWSHGHRTQRQIDEEIREFAVRCAMFGTAIAVLWSVITLIECNSFGWAIAGALLGGLVPGAFLAVLGSLGCAFEVSRRFIVWLLQKPWNLIDQYYAASKRALKIQS